MDPIYYYFVCSPANPGRRQLIARRRTNRVQPPVVSKAMADLTRGPGKVKTPELIMAATLLGCGYALSWGTAQGGSAGTEAIKLERVPLRALSAVVRTPRKKKFYLITILWCASHDDLGLEDCQDAYASSVKA